MRFDSSFRGMEGIRAKKGLTSFMFTTKSVLEVDHVEKKVFDVLKRIHHPDFDRVNYQAERMIRKRKADDPYLTTPSTHVRQRKTMMGKLATEKVSGYMCDLYDVLGLTMLEIIRGKADATLPQPPTDMDYDAYFAPSDLAATSSPASASSSASSTSTSSSSSSSSSSSDEKSNDVATPALVDPGVTDNVTDKLCPTAQQQEKMFTNATLDIKPRHLTAEMAFTNDFPLQPRALADILDMVSPASDDLAQVCNIMKAVPVPAFPMRMLVPMFPGISAEIKVGRFETCNPDESLFEIPSDFERVQ